MFLKRLENQLAQAVLRGDVEDRPQQREAAALAVDAVLPRRKRDVPPVSTSPFPDRKTDQLEAVERALGEVQFGVGEFSGAPVCLFAGSPSKRTGNHRLTPKK